MSKFKVKVIFFKTSKDDVDTFCTYMVKRHFFLVFSLDCFVYTLQKLTPMTLVLLCIQNEQY